MVNSAKSTLLLAVCTLFGAAIGVAIMPWVFPRAHTEMSRTSVLLTALRTDREVPPVVVLGDSAVMAGVDTRQLASAHGRLNAWNLGSTGQELSESLLIADALPDSVKTVVIGLHFDKMTKPATAMPRNKYVAYVMSGYRPSPEVVRLSEELQDEELHELLASNRLRVMMWSRWVIRASTDLSVRRSIREDMDLTRAETDLYHPSPYTRAVDSVALDHLMRTFDARSNHFKTQSDAVTLLRGIHDILSRRGKRVVFVVLPEHPRRRAMTTASFYADAHQWVTNMRGEGIDIIDLHEALDAGDFIDHIHPADRGAARLTSLISRSLRPDGA